MCIVATNFERKSDEGACHFVGIMRHSDVMSRGASNVDWCNAIVLCFDARECILVTSG